MERKKELLNKLFFIVILMLIITGFSMNNSDYNKITGFDKNSGTNYPAFSDQSFPGDTCELTNNILLNGNFKNYSFGSNSNIYPLGTSHIDPWYAGFAAPQLMLPNGGCGTDTGWVHFFGNRVNGSILKQSNLNILNGHKYKISICARLAPNRPTSANYGRIGVTFTSGATSTYPPVAGTYPGNYNGLVIGGNAPTTPAITAPGITNTSWVTYTYTWIATGNYNTLNLNPVNDNSGGVTTFSWMDIDNVYIREDNCSDFQSGMSPWDTAYGSPSLNTGMGSEDPGYVRLINGNKLSGSGIKHTLNTPIYAGKVYELKVNVRLDSVSAVNYGKLRVIAFNGSLPVSGSHPAPESEIAIIDISGKINCNLWATYTFERWKANKNFTKIAISVVNNFASSGPLQQSVLDIDNICFQEVNDSIPCYLADLDTAGNAIIPADIDTECPPALDDTVDFELGNVYDLYANCNPNGAGNIYENCPDSCASIGGEIPDSLYSFLKDDSLTQILNQNNIDSANVVLDSIQKIEDQMVEYATHDINMLDSLLNCGPITGCGNLKSIPRKGSPPDPSGVSPFEGRDIVFVHGFRTSPLKDEHDGVAGAKTRWPRDRSEFYDATGYWKSGANDYWNEHTMKMLGTNAGGGHVSGAPVVQNRFLVAAHPSTQIGIMGVHAILDQIAHAMDDNRGVINCGNARPDEKFGQNGYIIISHSAGALFSNVGLSITNKVNNNVILNFLLGDIGEIANRCDLHISLDGAFAGSAYAPLALIPGLNMLIGESFLGFTPDANEIFSFFGTQLLDLSIPNFLYTGEMFKLLCPNDSSKLNPFCYLKNMNLIEDVPMNVVTVASGSSSSYGKEEIEDDWIKQILAKQIFHRGFDDGVVSMDCACGNKDKRLYYPNRFLPYPGITTLLLLSQGVPSPVAGLFNERLYDLGIHRKLDGGPQRAIGYYLDQKVDNLVSIYLRMFLSRFNLMDQDSLLPISYFHASVGCLPDLSPTGMVQPVLVPRYPGVKGYDAFNRRSNFHSFIQSSSEHFSGSTNLGSWPDYKPSYGIRNWEEVLVTKDNYLYNTAIGGTKIVNPNIKNLVKRIKRGYKIGGKVRKIGRFRFTMPAIWIWKRYYDLIAPDDNKHRLEYVYNYILKN